MIQIALPPTRRKARIEIIPLIDIIFFLLATFVLVSMSMVKNQGLPIRLPGAAASKALDRGEALILRITQDGTLSIDKHIYAPDQLNQPLAAYQHSHADPKVVIQGDTDVAYGKVIHVLDSVRALGIAKVAVQTTPKPS
jgi:biopolymer transport protein ExbD